MTEYDGFTKISGAITPERTDGWPKDTGPLKVLFDLGMVKSLETRPGWLSYAKVINSKDGSTTYTASPRFLSVGGIRALAALTLEGWDVIVTAIRDELRIKITEKS